MRKLKISPGDRFGLWTIIREVAPVLYGYGSGHKERAFRVHCERCGKRFFRQLKSLRSGSKGCWRCRVNRATIRLNGLVMLLSEVLKQHCITRACYDQRRHRGWSQLYAATTPMQRRSR